MLCEYESIIFRLEECFWYSYVTVTSLSTQYLNLFRGVGVPPVMFIFATRAFQLLKRMLPSGGTGDRAGVRKANGGPFVSLLKFRGDWGTFEKESIAWSSISLWGLKHLILRHLSYNLFETIEELALIQAILQFSYSGPVPTRQQVWLPNMSGLQVSETMRGTWLLWIKLWWNMCGVHGPGRTRSTRASPESSQVESRVLDCLSYATLFHSSQSAVLHQSWA